MNPRTTVLCMSILFTGYLICHGTGLEAESPLYPSPAEASVAYDWLHSRVTEGLRSHPGWAVSEFEVRADPLPPGVISRVEASEGWATFGVAVPASKALESVQIRSFDTQTDVKVRWPDGSIRFAVVTAKIDKKGRYDVSSSEQEGGPLSIQASADIHVRFSLADGREFSANLPAEPSKDLWLNGAQVKEWRSVVAPENDEGQSHPFLNVMFDYRAYRDGQTRVDVTVENTFDIEGATNETYDVEILESDRSLFQKSEVNHHYLTRWRVKLDLDLQASEIKPDLTSAHEAGALPRFLPSIDKSSESMDGPDFEILGKGGNSYVGMGSTGGRKELACYPDSTARFIVHRTPRLLDYLLANGDLAGSWPVHIRETSGRLVSIEDRPEFWLDTRGKDQPAGDMKAKGPLKPDNAHQPSWAYVPYLVTGDRYYADEMAFWANYVLLRTWPNRRGGPSAGGYGVNAGYGLIGPGNQVRGFAWGLRNLVDAAAYLPDSYPEKEYLVERVQNNLDWADSVVKERKVLPTGAFALKPKNGGIALWQENFVGWALDHAHQQGFTGGEALLQALAGFQAKLFTSEPEFSREYAAPYSLRLGEKDQNGEISYFETMSELFEHNRAKPSKWKGDYAASARLMLMIQARPTKERTP